MSFENVKVKITLVDGLTHQEEDYAMNAFLAGLTLIDGMTRGGSIEVRVSFTGAVPPEMRERLEKWKVEEAPQRKGRHGVR